MSLSIHMKFGEAKKKCFLSIDSHPVCPVNHQQLIIWKTSLQTIIITNDISDCWFRFSEYHFNKKKTIIE